MGKVNQIARISADGKRTQLITEHSDNVWALARQMSEPLHNELITQGLELLSPTHDLGKCSELFGERLYNKLVKCDHSTAGGYECFKHNLHMIGMVSMGHHSEIPNLGGRGDVDTGSYYSRTNKAKAGGIPDYSGYESILHIDWDKYDKLKKPMPRFAMMMYMRMLESFLVDADRLDAASFATQTPVTFSTLQYPEMLGKLDQSLANFRKPGPLTALNLERQRILEECIRQGKSTKPGMFLLDVPTGGGKTSSSIAFGLNHAERNKLGRIIYVAPYLSIIDATAAFLTKTFGNENVLQHHSLAEPNEELSEWAKDNWDAPFVATSMVQFFETLFSNKPGKLRKLHNMARSVIILDEFQCLPQWALEPACAALHELVETYQATVVICTATPPNVEQHFKQYSAQKKVPVLQMKPICGGYNQKVFDRVHAEYINEYWENGRRRMHAIRTTDLAKLIASKEQALCIVNSRQEAEELSRELEKCSNGNLDGLYHITTYLVSEDRQMRLEEIRARLEEIKNRMQTGKRCLVIATSLIEAGIDVDFPVVFREMSGIDSIIQAAGRNNRNGLLLNGGKLYLFVSKYRLPDSLRMALSTAWHTLDRNPNLNILSPEMCIAYFEQRDMEMTPVDGNPIMNLINRLSLPFADVAERSRLIDEDMVSVTVPVGGGKALVDRLRNGERSPKLYNQLQSYIVNLYPEQYAVIESSVEEIGGLKVLKDMSLYDSRFGLRV